MPPAMFTLPKFRCAAALVATLACPWFTPPAFAETAEPIAAFSPHGTVKGVRQVTARFVAPMVALGDPRLADPFDIACPAPGHGRWADERDWVYDFDADLPGGVRCRFTLRKDLHALDGAPVVATRAYEFDTGGPSIRTSLPYRGGEIDEDQVFLLALDAEATTESIERAAYCAIDGIAERVPVRVLTGDERAAVLAQRNDLGYSYYDMLWKDGAQSVARVRDRTVERAEALVVALACKRRLPPDVKLQLIWGAGVAAPSGIATTLDQKLPFAVRSEFTARVECDRVNARAGCLPMAPLRVRFSAPVPTQRALAIRARLPDGTALAPTPIAGAESVEAIEFPPPFPDGKTLRVDIPTDLADDGGRPLANAQRFPLDIAIDVFPPLAKFTGDFGILEANASPVLPVTLRNVEVRIPGKRAELIGRQLRETSNAASVADWLRRVELANRPRGEWSYDDAEKKQVWSEHTADTSVFGATDTTQSFDVPFPHAPANADDTPAARPFGVVGIPLPQRGFYVVEIESRRLGAALLGKDQPRYVSTAVLVTNLGVHLKLGRESSRVWVTRLDDATPVANADVEITNYCNGALRWHGRTDADGVAVVDASFGAPHGGDYCGPGGGDFEPLMVSARTDDDFSFALSSWVNGIGPYEFQLPVGGTYALALDHTVLDRPLYRAGETVSMKHFVRTHTLAGVAVPAGVPGARRARVTHLYSDTRYELPVAAFDANGIAESTWAIPNDAKTGDYQVEVAADDQPGDTQTWRTTGRFKVEQFRLPTIRATVDGPRAAQLRPSSVALDLHASYLSGGSAANLPVKLRTTVESRSVRYADYDDYQFGGRDVAEGTTHDGSPAYDFEPEVPAAQVAARLLPTTLDANGAARVDVGDLPAVDEPSTLIAELDYADANGEILTSVGRVALWPAAVTLGIRRDGWVASPREMRFRVVALDLRGQPISGQRVEVSLYAASDYSYRKRLIGGFYAYENIRDVRKLEPSCAGRTDAHGLLACDVAPGVSGEVIAVARATDSSGHATHASTSMWVTGDDAWWFGGTVGERMDVLPEKKEYEAGDVARFQVRMPFRSATALVTVEREGVISSFVTTLSGREPVVEVPIDAAYAPNVFVSVFAVRGRVGTFFSWLADIARRFDLPNFIPRDGGRPTGLVD
ncbi:MAG TPA: MG2 domain-containing protein, partial [Pseudomonadales bacterium]|nr:MG2 domain-containing protein [Pseudomonadales bacterium]